MHNLFIVFIHLIAAGTGIGSLIFCLLVYLPAMEKLPGGGLPEEQTALYKTLDLLAPTLFVALLILVGTGIYMLLDSYSRQVDLPPGYYNLFGIKMAFAAGALFLSMYLTFTLRSRIAHLDLNPENRKMVPPTLQKMKTLNQILLGTMATAAFLGLWLARHH